MPAVAIPDDLGNVLDEAWDAARKVPGYLTESEARFLGLIAACTPCNGAIIEVGSFKGKSTVMLAKVSRHYGLGPIVAIDPHNFNSPELQNFKTAPDATSYQEFLDNLRTAQVDEFVDPRRAYSADISATWSAPIRFLWIDGDHSYSGAKGDFDGFIRHVVPQGVVAFHDALHEFSGPIRVFVEDILRSNQFGAAGFVGSIAWSQFRPNDGIFFQELRRRLERPATRLIPFVTDDVKLRGIRKILFKLDRSMVPRAAIQPRKWASLLNRSS